MAKRKKCVTCGKAAHGRDLDQMVDQKTGRVVNVCTDSWRCKMPYMVKMPNLKEGA